MAARYLLGELHAACSMAEEREPAGGSADTRGGSGQFGSPQRIGDQETIMISRCLQALPYIGMENWAVKEHWTPWKDIQGVWLNGETELQNSLPYRFPPLAFGKLCTYRDTHTHKKLYKYT